MARMMNSPRVSAPCLVQRSRRDLVMSAGQEVADGGRDFGGVGFQREMAGVEEAYRGVRNIALERVGAGRQEERIILAPHCEEGRLVGAEIILEGRVERDVALVVTEQIELH